MQTQPIGVRCPRCEDDIMCTVEVRLLTGNRTDIRVVDLADRFAEHYVEAGHSASKGAARRTLGLPDGPMQPITEDWQRRLAAGAAGARPALPGRFEGP